MNKRELSDKPTPYCGMPACMWAIETAQAYRKTVFSHDLDHVRLLMNWSFYVSTDTMLVDHVAVPAP